MLNLLLLVLAAIGLFVFCFIVACIVLLISSKIGPSKEYFEKKKKENWKPWLS